LPIAISSSPARSGDPLRAAFARRYWHPQNADEWSELIGGLVIWPIGVLLAALWFTARNGPVTRRRYGKSMSAQLREQLSLYFTAGILPPWYYIFSLHDEGAARAATFIQRFETKTCYFRLLKRRKGSPLNDKGRFAEYCAEHSLRCAGMLLPLAGSDPGRPLPDVDLFVKPSRGRGGRGAERWDNAGPGAFRSPAGEQLSADDLLRRLVARSCREPLIVQTRLRAHPDLLKLTAGALPTVRVLTCLNTKQQPEVMAAMIRTSFGKNTTVDNLHAGGIGALVDLKTGKLSKASNLGSDARLGWFSAHPDTGAPIEGSAVPCWDAVKALAIAAHRQFDDRVVIGWDIAVLEDGPILIEGNGNPDLDILQRFMRIGLREHRFAQLLAHHMRRREPQAAASVSR